MKQLAVYLNAGNLSTSMKKEGYVPLVSDVEYLRAVNTLLKAQLKVQEAYIKSLEAVCLGLDK